MLEMEGGLSARKQKRKTYVSEESKLCGARNLVLLCLLKAHQINVHTQKRRGKRKAIHLNSTCVSLIILDNGELYDPTSDPIQCEVLYYLFLIIAHFKSRTMEMRKTTLKDFWAFLKFWEAFLWKHFCWGSGLGVSGCRDGCLGFPFSYLFTLHSSPWKQGLLLRWLEGCPQRNK